MSTDTFRQSYRTLTDKDRAAIQLVKERADDLSRMINTVCTPNDPRAGALAQTKLEECVMWATKGITK